MDCLQKLDNILEYEFYNKSRKVMINDKAMKRLHVKIEDVKCDEDINEFIYQLKKNIFHNALRKVDETWYEVKEYIKKAKG